MSDPPISPPPRRRQRPATEEAPPQVAAHPADGMGANLGQRAVSALQTMSMRQRIDALRIIDPDLADNFIMDQMFQYMMTKTPIDIIAERMGYSVGWCHEWKQKVRARIRRETKELDVRSYVGELLSGLREIQAMGMREAASAKTAEWSRRMRGADQARNAIADQARLLQLGGAFDDAPIRPSLVEDEDDGVMSPAALLQDMSRKFLQGDFTPQPQRKPRPASKMTVEG